MKPVEKPENKRRNFLLGATLVAPAPLPPWWPVAAPT